MPRIEIRLTKKQRELANKLNDDDVNMPIKFSKKAIRESTLTENGNVYLTVKQASAWRKAKKDGSGLEVNIKATTIRGGEVDVGQAVLTGITDGFKKIGLLLGLLPATIATPVDVKTVVDRILSMTDEQKIQLLGKTGVSRDDAKQMLQIAKEHNLITEKKLTNIMEDINKDQPAVY